MNVSPVVVLAVGPEGEWPLLAMHAHSIGGIWFLRWVVARKIQYQLVQY